MRSILIVLESLGIGSAPDSGRYGDWGADTLGHLFAHMPELELPALFSLGLGEVLAGGRRDAQGIHAAHGRMRVASPGKDETTGHWEMAGVILDQPFHIPDKLPLHLIEAIETAARVEFLGKDGHADIHELWQAHEASGLPMLWLPPGESAIEIRADEALIPRRRLYEICRIARRHADALRIARVIAQPLGGKKNRFEEGEGRHEYGMVPPRTILNAIGDAGFVVEGIGAVPDLFARSGVTHSHAAECNASAIEAIEHLWERMHDGLLFASLPDFDRHGHARDVPGYAAALRAFDLWLASFLPKMGRDDFLIITADHGNDPSFRGAGHTREELPLLVRYDGVTGPLGTRETLADIAATLSGFFRLAERWPAGAPFLSFRGNRAYGLRFGK